ncbi:MAG: N-acetyltransferase [Actinomycetota bacterium]|nr:N-acetyltransferase [Actinomycetota bacterium]MDH5223235.1 N-acetyltransferase [Actinomycetota bacterium]MDH5312505.1 N-acetyltransferase [Actinomycetota bacterium]
MIVRLETPRDRDSALDVERTAFDGALEAEIVEAVRDEQGSFAFVAVIDGEVVGHVQMSRAWVEETAVSALGPIGVMPGHQRRGIGSALVRAALAEAERRDEPAVILLGEPAYYGRLGFVPASRFGLRDPFAGRDDGGPVVDEGFFQIALLDEDSAGLLAGEVRWHPAFG